MTEVIRPTGMQNAPGYSHAIKKSGLPVFISGQVAQDPAGNVVGEGGTLGAEGQGSDDDGASECVRPFHECLLLIGRVRPAIVVS